MKFGVVLCPRCRTARGARVGAKTALCIKCGKKIDLKRARYLCRVETESELTRAVQEYNKKLI